MSFLVKGCFLASLSLFSILSVGARESVTIGFDGLSTSQRCYSEDGYTLCIEQHSLSVATNQIPDPPAIFPATLGKTVTLKRNDGRAFTPRYVDIKEINSSVGAGKVYLKGYTAAGMVERGVLRVDGVYGFETVPFPKKFENLAKLTWNHPSPTSLPVVFDNVVVETAASEADIFFVDAKINKRSAGPGDNIQVEYRLKVNGALLGCFNMAIDAFRLHGPRKRLQKWGLPSRLCDDLQRGRTISQTWVVQLPDLGYGNYRLVLIADVDTHVAESSETNNERLFVIAVQHHQAPELPKVLPHPEIKRPLPKPQIK